MISLSTRSKEAIKIGLAMAISYGIALQMGRDNPKWTGFAVQLRYHFRWMAISVPGDIWTGRANFLSIAIFSNPKSVPARVKKEDIMQQDEQEDKTIYKVVVNHEEQYSIWPVDKENALGWTDEGKIGAKEECLAHIKEVWTDMRPLSLRKKMEKMAQNKQVV